MPPRARGSGGGGGGGGGRGAGGAGGGGGPWGGRGAAPAAGPGPGPGPGGPPPGLPPAGRGDRGGGRGAGPPRGGSDFRGRGGPVAGRGGVGAGGAGRGARGGAGGGQSAILPAGHIRTVGVLRKEFGQAGRAIQVFVNAYVVKEVPNMMIYHYDVAILPEDKVFPQRYNQDLIRKLQDDNRDVFVQRGIYDGKKNLFSTLELALGPTHSRTFRLQMGAATQNRPAQIQDVKITKAADINSELLNQHVQGRQAADNTVLTVLTALNVAIRMQPMSLHPYNSRSFFTPRGKISLDCGLEIWRGYFQSVRPTISRLLINVDISSALFLKSGPLIQVCLDYVRSRNNSVPNDPRSLSPTHGFPDRERRELQRFLMNARIEVAVPGGKRTCSIKGVSAEPASGLTFTRDGASTSVAAYYQSTSRALRFPMIPCVKVSSTAWIPLELCTIIPGQLVKKEIPEQYRTRMVEFSTKKPEERLASIKDSLEILGYTQSEYVKNFGLNIDTSSLPLQINARMLQPPALTYADRTILNPRNGQWNMADKKFFIAAKITTWIIAIFEPRNRFRGDVNKIAQDFSHACGTVGITIASPPHICFLNGQGNIISDLKIEGRDARNKTKENPNFLMAIVPEHGNKDIYQAVKYFGMVEVGIATQCLKSSKVSRANIQYWANVLLKVNGKLGGKNWIHDAKTVPFLSDPHNLTMIMGADVIHPGPGNTTSPSFAAVSYSVDSHASVYMVDDGPQEPRKEIIVDFQSMAKNAISMFRLYQQHMEKKAPGACIPKRIIFFRDGVSEGQFQQVKDQELAMLKAACAELGINPKITYLVVGKRHHYRFFPTKPADADRSGNFTAGLVVDKDITHPTDSDFYLQSHGGLLGTSRSAHYSVLLDESNFSADAIQSIAFALCHIYARATKSVSIPAPVYYADLVCYKAKCRFAPNTHGSDAGSTDGSQSVDLERVKQNFKPLHSNVTKKMYYL